jgi:hypothetical protein
LTPRPAFFNELGIAADIVRVPLTILSLVFSPGAIGFLLLLVNAAKIIGMLRSPLLIGLTFLPLPTFLAAGGSLSLFEARIRGVQTAAVRAPPLLWHKRFSPELQTLYEPRGPEAYGIGGKNKKAGEEKGKSYL